MTLWFLDASVLLASEDTDDDYHLDAVALLESRAALATLDLAFYALTNVAIVAWSDADAARRLRDRIAAIAEDGGIARADPALLAATAELAGEHGLSAYDAAYVAAAAASGGQLVSCDIRDLASQALAVPPAEAVRLSS